jgi:hypothetical protein
MNIIAISESRETYWEYILSSIADILHNRGHSVRFISKNDVTTTNLSDSDLMLVYSSFLTKNLVITIEKLQLPVILVVEASRLFNISCGDHSQFSKVLILKDTAGRKWSGIYTDSEVGFLNIPFVLKEIISGTCNKGTKKILVAFDGKCQQELLTAVSPALNNLSNYEISVIGDSRFTRKILNMNIRIVSKASLTESIRSSDIVIGNSFNMLFSVLLGKPAIVVGETGFGGLITPERILKQYNCFFSGRIGGDYGELIPAALLLEDIYTISEMQDQEINTLITSNLESMQHQSLICEERLNGIIEKIHRDHSKVREDITECKLVAVNDYSYSRLGNDEVLVSVAWNNHAIGLIDETEFSIIQQYRSGAAVSDAIKEGKLSVNESEYRIILCNLIKDKLLKIV